MKNPFSIFTVSVSLMTAGLLFTACGGVKYDPEVDTIIKEARNGILGELGAEIVQREAEIAAVYEAYRESEMGGDTAEEERLHEELDEMRSAWSERCTEIAEELEELEIETEIDDDVPLKVAEPFRVTGFGGTGRGNCATFRGRIEMTQDRPKIYDWNNRPDGYYKIRLAVIDGDGDVCETLKLSCDFNSNTGLLPKGEQAEVMFQCCVSCMSDPNDVASHIVTAKALRIVWEHPQQERMPDTVHGDLGIFGLRGPVKEVKWKTHWDTWTLYFNVEGQWTGERGRNTFNEFPKQTRDDQGRLTKMSDNYGETCMTFKYNADGLSIRETTEYMDGGGETTYVWDDEGFCTKEVNKYADMEGPEETTHIYTILEKDHHNNWTRRQNQEGKVESRTIRYYDEE